MQRPTVGEPAVEGKGDTTYLAVADKAGMMVSLIQSNFAGFGSGLVPDHLGFMLQNRGALFSLKDGSSNIYNGPEFFIGYAELRRTESGLNTVLKLPALMSLLPPSLDGLDILDLGCGFDDFASTAKGQGAAAVTGIDISSRMLAVARDRVTDPTISFLCAPIETATLGDTAFDLIASSLALHYIEDYAAAVQKIARALRPRGRFVFSVEHPIATANGDYEWQYAEGGMRLHWKLDRYREEGRRESTWFVDGVIKYHRTVETYVNG